MATAEALMVMLALTVSLAIAQYLLSHALERYEGLTQAKPQAGTIDDLDRRPWGLTWAKMGVGVHHKVVATAVFQRP